MRVSNTRQHYFVWTYSRSIQMNFPVSVLPSESVVLICLPRRKDLVYSKDCLRRSSIETVSNAGGFIDGGVCIDSSWFVGTSEVIIAVFQQRL